MTPKEAVSLLPRLQEVFGRADFMEPTPYAIEARYTSVKRLNADIDGFASKWLNDPDYTRVFKAWISSWFRVGVVVFDKENTPSSMVVVGFHVGDTAYWILDLVEGKESSVLPQLSERYGISDEPALVDEED